MDTNPAHDRNYQPQDGLRRAQGDPELRPNSSRLRSSKPPKSELRLSDPAASKSAGHWSTIREMARDFGVSIRALRFYEDRGLLHPRREGTARRYSARDRLYLKMILKGKQLGFTLSEIHDILAAREATTGDQNRAAQPSTMTELTTSAAQDLAMHNLTGDELENLDLEMGLPPEQIVAQIDYLERQRKDLDEAIVALRDAHRRLLQSPCRIAVS
ncbi:MerR family transcriptional regulator [Methylocapsa polymorpha]|uniref:MerR family transcriptional regulator n=1 Tax=Methylocapsa polymorpha TaxID=3080828 RepID=A0ABZ0HTV2_9HYPH|nr:MerR family transcriptional regulator [Methylocapsa sp. RX1]